MNKKQAKIAGEILSDWLIKQYDIQGGIDKIDCTMDFEMDGLTYYIFKFRRDKMSGDCIGVCGGFDGDNLVKSHIFGTFDDMYDKKTALDLGKKMASFIRDYQLRESMRSVLDAKFKANLKYIGRTEADVDKIAGQFVKTNSRFYLTVGNVDIPSGRVIVADPLCYLAAGEHMIAPVLEKEIPPGTYPAEVAIYRDDFIGIRMCTARLKVKDTKAARYERATPVPETAAAKLKDGIMSGFPVDAGMMCFCDSEGAKEFGDFIGKWHADNPGKNHYDDYFAAFFAESDKKFPAYQREGGDFIEWAIPETGKRIVMISSGLGDGFYQCFWGYDKDGEICELIVPMVDPDIFEN